MYKFSSKSKKHREGVDESLIAVSDLAIRITPIDFGIPSTGGLRTVGVQNMLFSQGKSKADGVLKLSKHQSGLAIDFFAYVDGKASWDRYHLAMVGASHLQAASLLGVRIEWGGLWKGFGDYPHIQLAGPLIA